MENEKRSFSLITGGSMGIGKSLAEACARRGFNLALVALPGPELTATAEALQAQYGVEVRYFGINLTEKDAAQKVWDWCQEEGITVNMLINNAGFGRSGRFETRSMAEYESMMQINNYATVAMTHQFLDHLKAQPQAWLMNMSSMEFALPLPYKAIYAATKAFVYSFTLILREELKNSPVKVSVLCPGSTVTNEDSVKRIQTMGRTGRVFVGMPDHVAETAIRNLLKGRAVIVPGTMNWIVVKLMKVMPTTVKMSLLERIFRGYSAH